MVNWLNMRDLNALRDRFESDVEQITNDPDLGDQGRARRLREISERFQAAYTAEKQELENAIEQHRRALTRKAYPAEQIGSDVQRELLEEMRAGRIEREIALQAESGGFNPVEAYEDARYRGDTARQAVIERVGRRYLPDDSALREQFSELVRQGREERMSPSQRAALKELEELERKSGEVGQALSLVDRTVRARLKAISNMPVRSEASHGLNNLNAGAGGYAQQG